MIKGVLKPYCPAGEDGRLPQMHQSNVSQKSGMGLTGTSIASNQWRDLEEVSVALFL